MAGVPGVPVDALSGGSPHGRIMNRNPQRSTQMSRSLANEGGPQVRGLGGGGDESGQDWSPYGTRPTHPYRVLMPRSVMSVEQATGFYQSAVNLWPANGQADYPNGQQAGALIRLKPTGSAHPGFMNPTGPNPNMVFISPPVYGYQTKPIMATGL
jgi:hypothetical protein